MSRTTYPWWTPSLWISQRGVRLLFALVLCIGAPALLNPEAAHGQAEANCTERLKQARDFYEAQRYDETISQLSNCLWREDLPVAYVEQAYRLLALTYLRLDDVSSAKLAVLKLLGRSPEYEPDPVQDLPSYVSLVRLVRQQVQLPADTTQTLEADPASEIAVADPAIPPPLTVPYGRRLTIALHVGPNNYHGERSASTGGTSEFTSAAGVGFGASINYHFTRHIDLGLYYLAGRYPSLLDVKGAAYRSIDHGASSDWLHMTGLLARVSFLSQRRVSPVVQLGLNGTFSLINGTLRAGVGPRFGIGADVRLTSRLDAFTSAEGIVVIPNTATDLASAPSSISDLFSLVTVGLRYQLAPSR